MKINVLKIVMLSILGACCLASAMEKKVIYGTSDGGGVNEIMTMIFAGESNSIDWDKTVVSLVQYREAINAGPRMVNVRMMHTPQGKLSNDTYKLFRDLRLGNFTVLGAAIFAQNSDLIEGLLSGKLYSEKTFDQYKKYLKIEVDKPIAWSTAESLTANITPMHLAVLLGNYKIVELLLQYGAKTNVPLVYIKKDNNEGVFSLIDLVKKEYKEIFGDTEVSNRQGEFKTGIESKNKPSSDNLTILALIQNGVKVPEKKEEKKLEQKKVEKKSVESTEKETKKETKSMGTQTELITNEENSTQRLPKGEKPNKSVSDLAASLKSLSHSFIMGLVTPQSDSNYFIPRLLCGGAAVGSSIMVAKKLEDKTQSAYLIASNALAYTAGLLTNTLLMKRLPKRLPRLQTTFACYPRLSNVARWVTGLGITGLLSWQNMRYLKV